MTGKTHVAAGLLVGAITVDHYHTDLFSTVTVICLAIAGSLLPDICHTRSKIGRQFKILSLLVSTIFGHRTFTHSLLFLGMIGFTYFNSNSDLLFSYYYRCNGFSCYTRYVDT